MFNANRNSDAPATIGISAKDLTNSGVTTTTTNDLFFPLFVAFYNNKINALIVRVILTGIIHNILVGIIILEDILTGIVFVKKILSGIIFSQLHPHGNSFFSEILNGIITLTLILSGIVFRPLSSTE